MPTTDRVESIIEKFRKYYVRPYVRSDRHIADFGDGYRPAGGSRVIERPGPMRREPQRKRQPFPGASPSA